MRGLHLHSPSAAYRRLVGVGGIGTGIFFELEGDRTLARNESRPARLLDIRDYCKLHIIAHYVAVLLDAGPAGAPFHVVPVGKVGDDERGHNMLREMLSAGMDVSYVAIVKDRPTLFSVCFQYPSGEGGNLTTTQSAAADLTPGDVAQAAPLFGADGIRSIALAAPEVPLEARLRLLQIATGQRALRVAAFTSSEMATACRDGFFSVADLISMNEDEAAALTGRTFHPEAPMPFLYACSDLLTSFQPSMQIIVSAGKQGAFAFTDGVWDHCPAAPVTVAGTAGAGDALLAGILSGLAVGMPLIAPGPARKSIADRPLDSALDFAVFLASYTVTSPHTIHPDVRLETLLQFAQERGIRFSDAMRSCFGGFPARSRLGGPGDALNSQNLAI